MKRLPWVLLTAMTSMPDRKQQQQQLALPEHQQRVALKELTPCQQCSTCPTGTWLLVPGSIPYAVTGSFRSGTAVVSREKKPFLWSTNCSDGKPCSAHVRVFFHMLEKNQAGLCFPLYGCCCLWPDSFSSLQFKIDGEWWTWIDYSRFQELIQAYEDSNGSETFSAQDYMAKTPQWALFGASERGFDPKDIRHQRKNKSKGVSGHWAYLTSGCWGQKPDGPEGSWAPVLCSKHKRCCFL